MILSAGLWRCAMPCCEASPDPMLFDLKRFGGRPVLILESREEVSYRRLDDLSGEIFAHLKPRALVLILCENELGALSAYVSCVNHGAVPILLDAKLAEDRLAELMTLYRPQYVICREGAHADLGQSVFSYCGYEILKTGFAEIADTPLHEDLALLLSTSGSTGSPKLVRLSMRNLAANTQAICSYLHIDESSRAITSLPMNYTYGLSVINTHLFAGASVVLTNSGLMQKPFWELLEICKVTTLAGIPYTYEMLNRLRFTRRDYPHLRQLTQAGGHLKEELQRIFFEYCKSRGKEFVVMYGQTEATARMSYVPFASLPEKLGSIGTAIPGGRLFLRDGEGQELTSCGIEGELFYEGTNVSMGYASCREDLARGDDNHGVLATGDLARRDADGFFYVTGRKKRFLKIFGNRVNLDECEDLLRTRFEISDIACTGSDEKLVIHLTDASLADVVKGYISDLTHLHPSAFRIAILKSLPRSKSGKILYGELQER